MSAMTRPAVFLDRDGVLVIPSFRDGRSFAPTTLADYRFYPAARASLESLKAAGYALVVVTNQPEVGLGLISIPVLREMHVRLRAALPVDDVRVCTHVAADHCGCRKPKPGMLAAAAAELGIGLDRSFMIGDRKSDIEAGRAAGCRTIFIDLDYEAEQKPTDADWTVRSIEEAVACILNVAEQG